MTILITHVLLFLSFTTTHAFFTSDPFTINSFSPQTVHLPFPPSPLHHLRHRVTPINVHSTPLFAQELTMDQKDQQRHDVGSVLGGLLTGIFGAHYGASLGSSHQPPQNNIWGLSFENMQSANDMGKLLDHAMKAYHACELAVQTQRNYAKDLETTMYDMYHKAKEMNDDDAWKLLHERRQLQAKLAGIQKSCREEIQRKDIAREHLQRMEERALRMDEMFRNSADMSLNI